MKHRIFALTLALLMVLAMSACKKNDPSQPVDQPNSSSESSTELPNPMVEQADGDYEAALGVTLVLPDGITGSKYYLIGEEIAQAEVDDGEGHSATLRFAKEGVENLSGVNGEWDETINGTGKTPVTVRYNKAGGVLAEWTKDGYAYSLYNAEAQDPSIISGLIASLSDGKILFTAEELEAAKKPIDSAPLEGGNPGTGLTEDELAAQAKAEAEANQLAQPDPGKPMEEPAQ